MSDRSPGSTGRGPIPEGLERIAHGWALAFAADAGIFEAGYTLPDGLARPWLRAGIDVASGGKKGVGDVFEFDFPSEPDVQFGFLQLHFSY